MFSSRGTVFVGADGSFYEFESCSPKLKRNRPNDPFEDPHPLEIVKITSSSSNKIELTDIPFYYLELIINDKLTDEMLFDLYRNDKTTLFKIALLDKMKDYIFQLLKVRGVPFLKSFKGLFPHQNMTLTWMKKRENEQKNGVRGGVVSLDMGLGKTLTSLTHILSSEKGEYPTLVVCSKTVMNVWYDEIDKFFGSNLKILFCHELFIGQDIKNITKEKIKQYDIVITTYDVCKSICRKTKINEDCCVRGEDRGILMNKIIRIDVCNLDTLNRRGSYVGPSALYCVPFERVIFDESQVFANPKTSVYKAVMALYGKYKWCLTGTPIRNYECDIWAQFRVLGYDRDGARTPLEWKRNMRLWEIDKLYEHVLKMGYKEAGIKLPPLIRIPNIRGINYTPIYLSNEEKLIYDFVLGKARGVFDKMMKQMCSFACVLALFTRLRQCTIAPYLMTEESKRKKKRKPIKEKEVVNMMKEITEGPLSKLCHNKNGKGGMQSTKIQNAIKILKTIPKGEKVLVFSTFTSCLDLLSDAIKVYYPEFTHLQLDGDVVGSERNNVLSKFRRDPETQGLFLTYKVGSEGLNLTDACHCICIEPWWTSAVTDQAISRLYRTGQTKTVTSYEIYISGTIEEKVIEICNDKRMMASELLDSTQVTIHKVKKNTGLDKNTLSDILGMSEMEAKFF